MSRDKQRLADCLAHVLEAIERINHYTENMSDMAFQDNRMVQDAVIRNFEIMIERASLTRHERDILASDDALREAARLARDRIPLDRWPSHIQRPMRMALCLSCDDTAASSNRVSAYRARDMLRFLKRRGIVACDADMEMDAVTNDNPLSTANAEYVMDRLLADLVPAVIRLNARRTHE
jgi:hypothetical protein